MTTIESKIQEYKAAATNLKEYIEKLNNELEASKVRLNMLTGAVQALQLVKDEAVQKPLQEV